MPRPTAPAGRFYKLFYLWSSPATVQSSSRASVRIPYRIHRAWRTTSTPTASHNPPVHRHFTTSHAPRSTSTSDPDTLPVQMRHLMRRVPHPVVILTATHPSSHAAQQNTSSTRDTPQPNALYRGMTISSFNTVCLEPRPVISFNMKLPSRTHDALEANEGFFLIHLLTEGQDGAALADSFTRGQEEVHRVLSAGLGAAGDEDKTRPAPVRTAADDATRASPMMGVGAAVSAVLRCRLLKGMQLRIEDHVVLCAEVFDIVDQQQKDGVSRSAESDGLSLLYADRAFRHVGRAIDLGADQNR